MSFRPTATASPNKPLAPLQASTSPLYPIIAANDVAAQVLKEDVRDALGILWTVARTDELKRAAQEFSGVIEVTDGEVAEAMRAIFECTHNVAEGAGAAPVAAAQQEKSRIAGRRIAVVLSGGNVDRTMFSDVLGRSTAFGI